MKQLTKVEVAQKLAATAAQLEMANLRDETLRKRFSTVLNAPTVRGEYTFSPATPKTYSWEEIFFEIGKLMPETNKVDVGRFNATLDILLEKLACRESKIENRDSKIAS